jgi:hypothetical protein
MAVLVYRLLACWSILPLGLLCWATQKTPANPTVHIGRRAEVGDTVRQRAVTEALTSTITSFRHGEC